MVTLEQRGKALARVLGENDPPLPSINDALMMAWHLSWDKILGELAQVSVTPTVHDGFISLYRDLETSSLGNEVADLKRQILELKSKLSIVKTAASEAKTSYRSEIEVAKVASVDKKKGDKILKLGRKLSSDGYNLCLKKMVKAYLGINTKVLDHIKVSDVENEEFENDQDHEDSSALTDP
ncbi:hypothetical protein F0562_028004 [Nyssa sinensis]|uniref:Uncharacterized protein n=1 Tax=Nyssa sinensis TaxID=561372 RepID=A0A5J5B7J6_9ASTE|nr:hypothetical protein F0562_028004 [Nyssa sinensis]